MQWEEIVSWIITRRKVSRDLWLLRPNPVIAHWVSYQQTPSSELGTSLPSNTGQNGHEMPPKVWSDWWPQGGQVNYKLSLTKSIANEWTTKAFSTCFYGDWTPCCYSCWPSPTPEGVQGGVRPSVLQGIWWNRSWDIFRNWFHDPNLCTSSNLENHLIPSRWHQLLVTKLL